MIKICDKEGANYLEWGGESFFIHSSEVVREDTEDPDDDTCKMQVILEPMNVKTDPEDSLVFTFSISEELLVSLDN